MHSTRVCLTGVDNQLYSLCMFSETKRKQLKRTYIECEPMESSNNIMERVRLCIFKTVLDVASRSSWVE